MSKLKEVADRVDSLLKRFDSISKRSDSVYKYDNPKEEKIVRDNAESRIRNVQKEVRDKSNKLEEAQKAFDKKDYNRVFNILGLS